MRAVRAISLQAATDLGVDSLRRQAEGHAAFEVAEGFDRDLHCWELFE